MNQSYSAASPPQQSTSNTESVNNGWLQDAWATLLIAFPVLGTFFSPETYFGGINGDRIFPIPVTQIFLIICSIYIVVHFIVLARRQKIIHEPLAYAFVILAFASTAWSYDPYTTFIRALRLLPIVGLGVLYSQAFAIERSLRIIVTAFLGSALCSIFVAIAFPGFGLDRLGEIYANAWRGAMINKNQTGFVYALGLTLSLFAWQLRLVGWRLALTTAACCAIIVVKAESTTAWGSFLLVLPPAAALMLLKRQPASLKILVIIVGVMIITAVVGISIEIPDVFDLIGKDATFNGRLPIWEAAWTAFRLKPIIGHAYGFWSIDSPERSQIWADIGLPCPHSHNSWLDLGVQLGVVGIGIVSCLTILAFARCLYCWTILSKSTALMLFILLLMLVIRSQTEVEFAEPEMTSLFWLVYISCVAKFIKINKWQFS